MEDYAKKVLEWLQKRVAAAEANDPELRPLKDRINTLSQGLKDASDEDVPKLLKEQNKAIQALINHIASNE